MCNYNFENLDLKQVYDIASSFIPYKLKKKINKTSEGRSGLEIYKRRNRRDYRVLIQYTIWNKQIEEKIPNILSEYESGYLVLISPTEYFGNNYPNPSSTLNPNFILGKTGFIYYSIKKDLDNYPPLPEWNELIELDTESYIDKPNWIGEYALNIKNANPKRISYICDNTSSTKKKEDVKKYVHKLCPKITNSSLDKLPKQCGIGNYDFDYASKDMQYKVKIQMLLLILSCSSSTGDTFVQYLIKNQNSILESPKDSLKYKKLINSDNFSYSFTEMYKELKKFAKVHGLINLIDLENTYAINSSKQTICPLCRKPIYLEEFFNEILQAEGRQVIDNTQREIVLMHITPLHSGKLNHKIYNLGWGHNYCNLIQGDKSIEETINELKRIVDSFDSFNKKK